MSNNNTIKKICWQLRDKIELLEGVDANLNRLKDRKAELEVEIAQIKDELIKELSNE